MEIYIIRHGDAVHHNSPGVTSDAMRELTREGREEVGVMAELLAKLGIRPALVLSSPYLRARQTAEIIAGVVGPDEGPAVSDELAYGGSLTGVLNDILSHGRPAQTVLAGHMPSVGRMVGFLAWRQPELTIPFRTGEICRIDLPDDAPLPGNGDLRWLIPPRIARKLLKPA